MYAPQVLERLNDLEMSGLLDGDDPKAQEATLRRMHFMCHEWAEKRLARFELEELAGKVSPNDKV